MTIIIFCKKLNLTGKINVCVSFLLGINKQTFITTGSIVRERQGVHLKMDIMSYLFYRDIVCKVQNRMDRK